MIEVTLSKCFLGKRFLLSLEIVRFNKRLIIIYTRKQTYKLFFKKNLYYYHQAVISAYFKCCRLYGTFLRVREKIS